MLKIFSELCSGFNNNVPLDLKSFILKTKDYMSGFNLRIALECPQCGAPAELNETDHIVSCPYCRVKSYLLQKDFFRYMLPHETPDNIDLIYFPFWRFKGTLFSYLPETINKRFMDISYQATVSQYFPTSLGLRPQALKLGFVTPDISGRFLKPTLSIKKIMNLFEARFNTSLSSTALHQAFIGDNLSMIYAPFYEKNKKLFDAVLNKPVYSDLPQNFDISKLKGGRPDWKIKFIPTLCPDCGWDLTGQSDALVLICKNCNTLWQPSEKIIKKLTFRTIENTDNAYIYLPFWRVKVKIEGIELKSYADLIKIANLPKVAQKGDEDIEFYFWVPGFKVQPRYFMNLSQRMTLFQPREKMERNLPEIDMASVTFPITEAVQSLKINLASFMKPPKVLEAKIKNIKIKPEKYLLVYVPFENQNQEYVQPVFKLAVNKNMLALSKNL